LGAFDAARELLGDIGGLRNALVEYGVEKTGDEKIWSVPIDESASHRF
jgi:hypothetical protein